MKSTVTEEAFKEDKTMTKVCGRRSEIAMMY